MQKLLNLCVFRNAYLKSATLANAIQAFAKTGIVFFNLNVL